MIFFGFCAGFIIAAASAWENLPGLRPTANGLLAMSGNCLEEMKPQGPAWPQMNAEFEEALRGLPHGTAFRFVDELLTLDPGKEATAIYQIKGSEAFLEGHFPGNPMMPGVILLEAIAQLGGVVAQTDPLIPAMADLRLTAVRATKILGAAVPGETLEIRAKVEGRMGGLVQIEGEITVGDNPLASARITLSGTPS
jgi:3-hydroxyacyl-[acyl-carrier-protein] dehydratase